LIEIVDRYQLAATETKTGDTFGLTETSNKPATTLNADLLKTLAAQGSVQAVYDVEYLDGTRRSMRYNATSDGKEHPFIGSRFGDTISIITSDDPRRFTKIVKKAGVVTLTEDGVISADGRTLTVTMKRPGESQGVIEVFDKR